MWIFFCVNCCNCHINSVSLSSTDIIILCPQIPDQQKTKAFHRRIMVATLKHDEQSEVIFQKMAWYLIRRTQFLKKWWLECPEEDLWYMYCNCEEMFLLIGALSNFNSRSLVCLKILKKIVITISVKENVKKAILLCHWTWD